MNFTSAVKAGFNNYVNFNGRAARSEFWYWVLFSIICYIVASIVDNVLGTTFKMGAMPVGYGWFYVLVGLGLFLPSLAVAIRRLHDIGKSGWWYLIVLIPLLGAIIFIVWACGKSETGDNRFGSAPALAPA